MDGTTVLVVLGAGLISDSLRVMPLSERDPFEVMLFG